MSFSGNALLMMKRKSQRQQRKKTNPKFRELCQILVPGKYTDILYLCVRVNVGKVNAM